MRQGALNHIIQIIKSHSSLIMFRHYKLMCCLVGRNRESVVVCGHEKWDRLWTGAFDLQILRFSHASPARDHWPRASNTGPCHSETVVLSCVKQQSNIEYNNRRRYQRESAAPNMVSVNLLDSIQATWGRFHSFTRPLALQPTIRQGPINSRKNNRPSPKAQRESYNIICSPWRIRSECHLISHQSPWAQPDPRRGQCWPRSWLVGWLWTEEALWETQKDYVMFHPLGSGEKERSRGVPLRAHE